MWNKKGFTILLGLALMLTVVACGNKEMGNKSNDKKAKETVQSETDKDVKENENIKEDTEKETETSEDTTKEETPVNTEDNNTQSADTSVEKITMYAKSSVNVRSGAGTSNSRIGSLSKGQEVTKVGEENGWSKIEFNGTVGYVSSKYLSTEKVSVSTANNTGSTSPSTSNPVQTPAQTNPSTKECEHWYDYEHIEYEYLKHYIYGCNGCGYPLFTIEGRDAVNLPNLYSHPACYSEKLGMDCVGGGFHSEVYYGGYCGHCHDEIQMRSCMFSQTGEMCVKNEALGPYEKVVLGQNPQAFIKSCECGENLLLVDGSSQKGLMISKKTCTLCGYVETYPKK